MDSRAALAKPLLTVNVNNRMGDEKKEKKRQKKRQKIELHLPYICALFQRKKLPSQPTITTSPMPH